MLQSFIKINIFWI